MGALSAYPSYKPARVHWLGDVPAHWSEKRGKYFFREIDNRSQTGEEELLSISHITGVTPRSQKNVTMFKAESYVGHKIARPNDIVINTMWAWMSALGVSKDVGIVSPSYGVYRPLNDTDFVPSYLDYLLRAPMLRWEYNCRSTGIRASRLRLYPDKFLDIAIPCPPREEQERMVGFLRAKDAQVRRLIRNKRRLIGLLNEQKQAIINRAVTRGLNPDAPMKPTGIDWMPEVPAHWEVKPLKRLVTAIVGGSTPPSGQEDCWDGDIVWVTPEDISRNARLLTSRRTITKKGLSACSTSLVPPGSVIITSRAPVGNVSIAEVELATNQGCKALVPNAGTIDSHFLFQLMRILKPELQSLATGTTFTEISTSRLGRVKVAAPSVDEQQSILDLIRNETRDLERAIEKAGQGIVLINEYRERLIADVVTGKLDVRHFEIAAPTDEPTSDEGDALDDEVEANDNEVMEEADADE